MRKQKDLIHNTEWDYLIILDACRYDYFKEVNWLPGELQPAWSEGSATDTWFPKTFEEAVDAALITQHPFFSQLNPKGLKLNVFNPRIFVEKGETVEKDGVKMDFVPPEHTTDKAVEFIKNEDKKVVIHYVQPHAPFLGYPEIELPDHQIYDKIRKGELSLDFVKEAYKGNLIYALKEAFRLLKEIGAAHPESKAIITSDHGELLGEHGMFGHPHHVTCKKLRTVPWFICD